MREKHQSFGVVEYVLNDSSSASGSNCARVEPILIRWRPDDRIRERFEEKFEIAFQIQKLETGERRFMPVGGFKAYALLAARAGMAILERDGLMAESLYCFGESWQYQRRLANMQAVVARRFLGRKCLEIKANANENGRAGNVLEFFDDYQNDPQAITKFISKGKQRARLAGCGEAKIDLVIQFALLAHAEQDTNASATSNSPQKFLKILQSAYLNDESMVDVDKQTLMHIKDRVLKACQVKQNDDDQTFYRWLCGNGFYKSIGKKALSPGGELPIDCIRSAMTHLGWEATHHWSRYINAFSSMLSSMMPELTKNERRWFDGCYCARRVFGGFSLSELFGMLPGLPLILSLLWQNPYDPQRLQMLHRMLFYYSQMVHLRRLADRTSKRKQARTQISIAVLTSQCRSKFASTPFAYVW